MILFFPEKNRHPNNNNSSSFENRFSCDIVLPFLRHGVPESSGLAMGPSLATLALAANWNYFEISLTGAVCALLSALFSVCALRDVGHAGST